jgi:hypothetical protein
LLILNAWITAMANDNRIRIRLRAGNREIEAEGTKADLLELLEKYWAPVSLNASEEEEEDHTDDKPTGNKRKPMRARPSKPKARATNATNEKEAFDANGFANMIKGEDHFPTINTKLIQARGILFRKACLVLRYSDEPLTSGEIQKALEALGIKVQLGNLSNSLKDNLSSLMSDAARTAGKTPRYKLTARAITEFDEWLKKNDE